MNTAKEPSNAGKNLSKMKILIVDDEPSNVALLEDMLSESGYTQVKSIMDPRLTLETCKTFKPDLILLDLIMPYVDGFTVLDAVRAEAGFETFLPIIVLTADVSDESKRRALRAGATDFLLKPFDQVEVLLRMAHVMERRRIEYKLQRQTERAALASAAKNRFLASMSHELRTPLNAIIGFTGTLLMELPGPLTVEQRNQLQTIKSSAHHQLSLINDLLDLAKIESGKVELKLAQLDCAEVVRQAAETLRPLAEEKGLRFQVNIPSELICEADRRALHQITMNLLNNAIKFTNKGTVGIDVFAKDGLTNVRISDTGIGIRREDHPKLFDAFARLETGGHERKEGTGLGLHLSRQLAHLLDGEITFTSEAGRGSAFTLSLHGRKRQRSTRANSCG